MTPLQAARSLAERVSCLAGHPVAQAAFLASCGFWLALGGAVDVLTLILSVLAISLTQMVLSGQERITKAEHAKLDAIIEGTDADNRLQGIEKERP